MTKRKLSEERRIYLRWQTSERRRKIKKKAIDYKGGKCEKCGYSNSMRSLVFHHLNPKEKDFAISNPNTKSWEKIKLELDKCILLCTNCHGEIHDEWDRIKNEESYLKLREIVPERKVDAGSVYKKCFNCEKEIKIFKSAENKKNFCSRKCSDEVIYNTPWDSDEIMINLIKSLSIKDLSLKFNRSRSTTYAYVKKIKEKYKI